MKYILDASFFFGEFSLEGELYTTPNVVLEIRDIAAKMRYEVFLSQGLCVTEPDSDSVSAANAAALASGDKRVLSKTDVSVIALGVYLSGTVVSDDFAVQNVCRHLKVPVKNLMQRRAKKRVWKSICSGCGAEITGEGECQICGSMPRKRGSER